MHALLKALPTLMLIGLTVLMVLGKFEAGEED